jgi:hypothetical protein
MSCRRRSRAQRNIIDLGSIIHKIFADVRSILLKSSGLDGTYVRKWLSEVEKSPEKRVNKGRNRRTYQERLVRYFPVIYRNYIDLSGPAPPGFEGSTQTAPGR